jgi:uncharacterized membrane protein YphA (DoxX/SURF4 family)
MTDMLQTGIYQKVYNILRIAVAMCFIGHGAFGIITKPIWCNYFAVFGIGHDTAYHLMPVVGSIDILLGVSMLVYPMKIVPAWLVVWGIVTASLRPLSGEPFAELIERSGNFGAPLALLILCGGSKTVGGWFAGIKPSLQPDQDTYNKLFLCLKLVVFLLFAGHGWLNLVEKKGLIQQYTSLGFSNPVQVAQIAGTAEIIFALLILIKPARPLLLALFIWKAGTELFYPHYELFEWIERGGSYGTVLALWMLTGRSFNAYIPRWPFTVGSLKAEH